MASQEQKAHNLTSTELDNLIWAAFEQVASDADAAHRRIEAIDNGTADLSKGLGFEDALKKYRQTLQIALLAVDAAIEKSAK